LSLFLLALRLICFGDKRGEVGLSSDGAAEQALAADSPVVAFIRSCVGEPLKHSVMLLLL
jgi:hypothetical protein